MPAGGNISTIGSTFEELINGANGFSEALAQMQGQLSNAVKEMQKNSQQVSSVIAVLTQNMAGLQQEAGKIATSISGLGSSFNNTTRSVQAEAASVDDMWETYKKMGIAVDDLKKQITGLDFSQKEINKVVQLGTKYNKDREDSYKALSEKYRAIMILIDQLTEKEREETKVGRELVETSAKLREQMNKYQQQSGNYTLQVGNYSKALNGLNIATTQVIRELPVLANGVSMFAIAISNNIPILAEQIVRTKEAYNEQIKLRDGYLEAAAAAREKGHAEAAAELEKKAAKAGEEAIPVGKALIATLTGWQTWLVAILAILPGLIRKIQEKKKAQQEANQSTKEAIEYEKLLKNAYIAKDKEEVKSVATLQTLYTLTQDINRSNEERLKAAKALKTEFQDEFNLFSEEEIVMGNAVKTYNAVTDALFEMAKARAYQNKITELYEQAIDQKAIRDERQVELDAVKVQKASIDAEIERQKVLGKTADQYQDLLMLQSMLKNDYEKANAAYMQADMPLQEIDNAILKLREDMPTNGIISEILNGPRGRNGDGGGSIQDYYWEMLTASANALSEGLERDLALLEVAWMKEQKGYNDALAKLLELRKTANEEEREEINTQINYVIQLMKLGEEKYDAERKKMIRDRINSYEEVVEVEEDVDAKALKNLQNRLAQEKAERESLAYEEYENGLNALRNKEENAKSEAELKEKLNQTLLDSEKQYWVEYLEQLRKQGLLTTQEYNKIMAQLTKESDPSRANRRRGRRYGGIVEAIMAQTSKYGDKDHNLKDEYKDFVTAVDSALKDSMKLMDEWMDKRMEMAQIAVQAAEKEVDAARNALNYELEARNQGYANSVETARKELDLARANHKKALDEQKRVEQEQLAIDAMTQASSLITATANIWAAYTKVGGFLGPFLAAAATAAMWGAFTAAQVKAYQVTQMKSEQYGDGTVEMLEGGSHASGHDIDLGTKKDGTRRRAEGGEYFAIINKRNSRKYGSLIPDVINAFNDGTFGEKYQRANAAMGNFALGLLTGGSPTDVSTLEREVRMIREQGEENRYTDSRGNVVIRYKNLTRKYKI